MRRTIPLLLLASCTGTQPVSRVASLVGDPAAIRGPATAYRIDRSPDGRGKKMYGYAVLSGPVAVDATLRDELADVFLSDSTYVWDAAKACAFLPGILLRYGRVDVLLCFSCDELEVYLDGKKVGHEDFDPRRKDLVRIAKRLFPKDVAIQKLEP